MSERHYNKLGGAIIPEGLAPLVDSGGVTLGAEADGGRVTVPAKAPDVGLLNTRLIPPVFNVTCGSGFACGTTA